MSTRNIILLIIYIIMMVYQTNIRMKQIGFTQTQFQIQCAIGKIRTCDRHGDNPFKKNLLRRHI